MRLTWALLAFLESAVAADSYAAVALTKCTNNVGCAGYYRALGVSTSPANSSFGPPSNVTGVSVGAIGVQAASNGVVTTARVDVAGIRFKTPADTSDGGNGALSFYFGYLGVGGSWNNSTQTAAVVGAVAEVVSVLSSVNVYYDNDNTAGFKWDVSQPDAAKRWDIFNNADGEAKGYDTLDARGGIDFVNNLTWTPINHTKVQCNTQAGLADTPDTCEIHSLSTAGFLTGSANVDPVITVIARIASQPIYINDNKHGPDRIKFDIRVQYPWADMTALYSPAKAKLTLISFAAGKSGAFVGAAIKRSDSSDSLVFATSGGNYAAYYAYKQTATIDSASASITTQVITGEQIQKFDCTGAPCLVSLTNVIAFVLKTKVGWLQLVGWKASLAFHSLGTGVKPLDVYWDPETGAVPMAEVNSGVFAAPSLLFAVALLLF